MLQTPGHQGSLERSQAPSTVTANRRRAYLVWRHRPLLLALALAGAVRAVAWLAIYPAWWFIGDSVGYVTRALAVHPDEWRPIGYSILVLWPLRHLHDLALVTALQHLMGLGTGALVYVVALRLGLPIWAGTLAALPALFDAYVIASEQMLLSEPVFSLLVVGALALILWRGERPHPAVCAAAGLLLGLSAVTRTVGIPLLAIACLALALRRQGWLRLVALCLAFTLPVGAYVLWFSHAYHRVNVTVSAGLFLYGRASQFVDCTRVTFADDRLRRLCPAEPVGARDELFYVFSAQSPALANSPDRAAANDLAGRFALAAVRAQPGDYAALAWRDLAHSFGIDQGFLVSSYLFRTDEPMPGEARAAGTAFQGRDPGPAYRQPLVRALAGYQDVVWVPGLACLLALAAAAAGLLFGRDPDRRGLRVAVLLTAGPALVMFALPPLTVAPDPRYRLPAIPLLCLAVAAGGRLLANRLRRTASG